MYDPKLLSRALREGRGFRNKSQQDVADHLDVHVTSVNKWEVGKNHPNADVVARIADYLRLSLDYFLRRRPKKNVTWTMRTIAPRSFVW